ncbi:GDSL esterase/lipase At3g26430-like [Salvia splendens]|uniref:GDSL esterase/lipase At3g26430-like n=1 Tax=Salvia splendens TaxID=180675 RepID=UPI001C274F06|nr:GDSL esterase/lipase At3g26430-like [Salvia splendens]
MEFKFSVLKLHLIALFLLPTSTLGSNTCNFPAIFNFGDSNSDTGGLSAAFGQAPPPNGATFFHSPSGRYCDGRLLIDFIAESVGLPYLDAFLDSMGTNFRHGCNFATAESTIRRQNTTIWQSGYSPISLDVQHLQFSDFLTRSQNFREKGLFQNLFPEEDYISRALYTFDIGQNDLTAGYKLNLSTEEVKAYVPDVLGQLSHVIKVRKQPGRTFWVHNTGPVGCLPYVMDRFLVTAAQIDKHGCSSPYNDVSQYFNLKLRELVLQLRDELPAAAITYVDVYVVKYSLISQANKLGFENPFVACCGHEGKYNYNRCIKCGSKTVVNGTETVLAVSCKDPSTRISWDGTHFTEAANRYIFDQVVGGAFSDPPVSLKFACNRMNTSQK